MGGVVKIALWSYFSGRVSRCFSVMDFLQMFVIFDVCEEIFGERFVFIVARRWTLEKVVKHKCENGSARHAIRMTLVPVGAQKISKTSKISKISKKTRMASNTPSAPEGTVADIYIYICTLLKYV